jgi:hypothetical protein
MNELNLDLLTTEEKEHLREQKVLTHKDALITFTFQKKERDKARAKAKPGEFWVEPCHECKQIAKKLGFAV